MIRLNLEDNVHCLRNCSKLMSSDELFQSSLLVLSSLIGSISRTELRSLSANKGRVLWCLAPGKHQHLFTIALSSSRKLDFTAKQTIGIDSGYATDITSTAKITL